jgi:WD40 repeat protein
VKVKPGEKSNSVLWSPVLFLKPDEIISGCSNAEVISWNPQEDTPTPTLLHSEHTRGLFCLAFNSSTVWSLAQDRLLIHHDLVTKTTTTFPTLGGFAYCIAPCPFAPGRVAIGVGDETIRVWSLTDNTGKSSASLWQRIKVCYIPVLEFLKISLH